MWLKYSPEKNSMLWIEGPDQFSPPPTYSRRHKVISGYTIRDLNSITFFFETYENKIYDTYYKHKNLKIKRSRKKWKMKNEIKKLNFIESSWMAIKMI